MKKVAADQKCLGFTLLELMAVLAIIAVLSVAAVSNFSASIPRYKLREAVNEILALLECSRLRAVKENGCVVVLFDPDGNGRLDGNYIAFVDSGSGVPGDWAWQPEAGESLITKGQLPAGVHITRTSFSKNRLRFNSQGHLMGINRSIYLKNSDDKTKKITVYASGNSRAF